MTTSSEFFHSTRPRFESPPPFPSQHDFAALVGRAEEGDVDASEELQLLLDHYDELSQPLRDLSRLIEHRLLGMAAGDSALVRKQIDRFIAGFRGAFLNGAGDPMEEFLIHRIVVSHLEVMIRMNRAAEFVDAAESHRRDGLLEAAKRRQVRFLAAFREYREVREYRSP